MNDTPDIMWRLSSPADSDETTAAELAARRFLAACAELNFAGILAWVSNNARLALAHAFTDATGCEVSPYRLAFPTDEDPAAELTRRFEFGEWLATHFRHFGRLAALPVTATGIGLDHRVLHLDIDGVIVTMRNFPGAVGWLVAGIKTGTEWTEWEFVAPPQANDKPTISAEDAEELQQAVNALHAAISQLGTKEDAPPKRRWLKRWWGRRN